MIVLEATGIRDVAAARSCVFPTRYVPGLTALVADEGVTRSLVAQIIDFLKIAPQATRVFIGKMVETGRLPDALQVTDAS
jgi:hypothetical protein